MPSKPPPHPTPSPVPRPTTEVLCPISFQEDASKSSTLSRLRREERGLLGLAARGGTRGLEGWAAWARSLAGNGRTTGKTLTNILVEGIGGKERHVRCVPRCPQGLPLDTAAVNARQRKEAAQVQTQPRVRAVQGPLGPSSLPPQQQRRRRQRRRSGAGPRAGRVGNPGDLSAACSSSDKNPAFPPRPTRGASSTDSFDDLPQVRGISGYVLGFSIARASREDEVLQAHRGRLNTSGVN